MCTLGFQLHPAATYRFVFAGNRDEAYDRPTKAIHFWPNERQLIAGQDLLHKGTWLGLTRSGRFAVVTNIHAQQKKQGFQRQTSRGNLVKSFLTETVSAEDFGKKLKETRQQYAGYNFLFGDIQRDKLFHYNNLEDNLTSVSHHVHGISNASLDTPWPKLEKIKAGIANLNKTDPQQDAEYLFQLLQNNEKAADEQLPKTDLPIELEREASSIFVRSQKYGTVSSSVILIDQQWNVLFKEKRFDQDGEIEENTYTFRLTDTTEIL